MTKVFVVAGLGFGDEGKGTITEYLTYREKAHTVVRYNGGAQAAHNVVRADGKEHTFSQFGSGTFEGAATHLSKFVIADPVAIMAEGTRLIELGVSDVFENLTIEDQALLISPYQKGANRIREALRGNTLKHGTCGVGIGETVSDNLTNKELSIVAGDLKNIKTVQDKLSGLRELKLKEFSKIDIASNGDASSAFELISLPVKNVIDKWMLAAKTIKVVPSNYLPEVILKKTGAVVFEGAQGVLLDELWGFHPYTTWTNITFTNADYLLDGVPSLSIEKIGVVRTYLTRHGVGPFPTELSCVDDRTKSLYEYLHKVEKHNKYNNFQTSFRVGHFDLVMLQYALSAIGHVDQLAVTHMDVLPKLQKICISYGEHGGDIARFLTTDGKIKLGVTNIEYQSYLSNALKHPGLDCKYWPINNDFINIVEDISKVKVGTLSKGPLLSDKTITSS